MTYAPLLLFALLLLGAPLRAGDAPATGSPAENSEQASGPKHRPPAPRDVTALILSGREAWQKAQQVEQRIRKGNPADDYIKLLDELEAAYQKALDIYAQALRESPQNPIVFSDLGRLWLSRHDRVQAGKYLNNALLADDSSKMLSATERADIHRALGGLLERAGIVHSAQKHYKHAFNLNAGDVRNRISLAIANCASGSPQDAVDLLREFCTKLPARETQSPVQQNVSALALYTLALAQEEIGQPEDALANYQAAWKRCSDPSLAENWGVLERAEAAVWRLEDAFDAMARLEELRVKENQRRLEKKLTPLPSERENYATAARWVSEGLRYRTQAMSDPAFLKALSAARGASGEPNRDELAQAANWETFLVGMDYFQRAASTFPHFGRAYYELAASNVMLGRYGAARKLLDEAVACSPNNIAALNLYGDVLLQLGQWNEAQRTFKRLRTLEPESGRANLGWAQATAGLKNDPRQVQQALDALDRAEQLGVLPDDALRKDLVAAAEQLQNGKHAEPPKIRGRRNRNSDEPQPPAIDFWRGSYWDK